MLVKAASAFESHFRRPPEIMVRAPGRVNLLGGHTDYNEGYVLPVAVDRAAWVAAAPTAAREARIHALDLDSAQNPCSVLHFTRNSKGGVLGFSKKLFLSSHAAFPLAPVPPSEGNWADYPRSVAWALQERGLTLAGMEALLTSDVPVGAGLSSSAAVEVAFACAWQTLSGFALDRRELALTCQRAESGYVGVNCGILDQMASSCGVEGHALLLDCRTLEIELVPLPADIAIVVADTGVRRQLASSEYNLRRAQCERAVRILRERLPSIRALRDVSADDLERLKERLPEIAYRRARHIVSDNARVLQAAQALRAGDAATVGALMKACHISLRDDYEVSAPELDTLASAAWEVEGCYGARLTGAGFGGCIVALVVADRVPDFETRVSATYEAAFGRKPDIYACRSADGVSAEPSLSLRA